MKSGLVLICLLMTFNSFAQVTTVKKGDLVPYDGVLFSKDKELKLRELNEECAVDKKRTDLLRKMNELNQRELDVLEQRLDNYRKEVRDHRRVSDFERAIYFFAGALITGAISYGVVQANK